MTTLNQLKSLAARLGCSVEDDKENTTLYVHASDGKAWDDGSLTSLVHSYGCGSGYLPEWRKTAIADAFDRLHEVGAPDSDAEES